MKNVANSDSELIFAPAREGEQSRSAIDQRAAADMLGWSTRETLHSGLSQTLQSYTSRDNAQ